MIEPKRDFQTVDDILADPVLGPQLDRLIGTLCRMAADQWWRLQAKKGTDASENAKSAG